MKYEEGKQSECKRESRQGNRLRPQGQEDLLRAVGEKGTLIRGSTETEGPDPTKLAGDAGASSFM